MGFYRETKEKLARLQATSITYGGKYAEAKRASTTVQYIPSNTAQTDLGTWAKRKPIVGGKF